MTAFSLKCPSWAEPEFNYPDLLIEPRSPPLPPTADDGNCISFLSKPRPGRVYSRKPVSKVFVNLTVSLLIGVRGLPLGGPRHYHLFRMNPTTL